MTKTQTALSVVAGFILATTALVILSFTLRINKEMEKMRLEKQIKHDLIERVKDSCDPVYPVVHAAIYLDRVVVECRTE